MQKCKWVGLILALLAGALLLNCDDDKSINRDDDDIVETVFDLTVRNDQLIAAGSYWDTEQSSPVDVPFVWRWNPPNWDAIAPGLDGTITALTVFDGDLIASGAFTTIGGVSANHIARWDGSAWHALGTGLDSAAHALLVHDGNLIAAGDFVAAGGSAANHIARWTGSAWQAMGSGLSFDRPTSLAVYNGSIAAGGFQPYQGQGFVFWWNGSAWTSLTSDVNGFIEALATYNGSLIAAGDFDSIGTVAAASVARWNGSSWSPLGAGLLYPQGQGWSNCMCVHDGNLVVAGQFSQAGSVATTNIARWNGSTWQAYESGLSGHVEALAVLSGDLVAGGGLIASGQDKCLARWTGSSWSFLK